METNLVFEIGDKLVIINSGNPQRGVVETDSDGNYFVDGKYRVRVANSKNVVFMGPESLARIKKLSSREKQVIELLKKGFKNKEIAKEVGINEKTVSTYKARLKEKLGIALDANEYVFVTRAIELGVI